MAAQVSSPLLALPRELRDQIWENAAANGAWTSLLPCCSQIREELSDYCYIPDDINSLEHVVITVDSTDIGGVWLKVQCVWRVKRRVRAFSTTVELVNGHPTICTDPFRRRLKKISRVANIEVKFIAPTSGHFLGAFLVMFFKTYDVDYLIEQWRKDRNRSGTGNFAALTVVFETEVDAGGESSETSFWECRFEAELLDDRYCFTPTYTGRMPYCYEYFLAWEWQPLNDIPSETQHISLPPSLPGSSSTLMDERYRAIIEDLPDTHLKDMRLRTWESRRSTAAYDYAAGVSKWTPTARRNYIPVYTSKGDTWIEIVIGQISEDIRHYIGQLGVFLEMITYHHDGPAGGPLDMLRLHWLKSTEGSSTNYIANSMPSDNYHYVDYWY